MFQSLSSFHLVATVSGSPVRPFLAGAFFSFRLFYFTLEHSSVACIYSGQPAKFELDLDVDAVDFGK